MEFSAQQAGPVAAAHARGSADEAPHRGGKVHPAAQKLRQGGSQPGGMDAGAGTVGSGQGVPNGQAAGSSSSSSATPFAAVAKVGLSGPGSEGGARRDSASGSRVPVFDGMARGSPRHASALHTEGAHPGSLLCQQHWPEDVASGTTALQQRCQAGPRAAERLVLSPGSLLLGSVELSSRRAPTVFSECRGRRGARDP